MKTLLKFIKMFFIEQAIKHHNSAVELASQAEWPEGSIADVLCKQNRAMENLFIDLAKAIK